jgi:hypothetical protein
MEKKCQDSDRLTLTDLLNSTNYSFVCLCVCLGFACCFCFLMIFSKLLTVRLCLFVQIHCGKIHGKNLATDFECESVRVLILCRFTLIIAHKIICAINVLRVTENLFFSQTFCVFFGDVFFNFLSFVRPRPYSIIH